MYVPSLHWGSSSHGLTCSSSGDQGQRLADMPRIGRPVPWSLSAFPTMDLYTVHRTPLPRCDLALGFTCILTSELASRHPALSSAPGRLPHPWPDLEPTQAGSGPWTTWLLGSQGGPGDKLRQLLVSKR